MQVSADDRARLTRSVVNLAFVRARLQRMGHVELARQLENAELAIAQVRLAMDEREPEWPPLNRARAFERHSA